LPGFGFEGRIAPRTGWWRLRAQVLHDLKMTSDDRRSLFELLLGDGRPLLVLTGIALFASGGFAILQSMTGHLLPHDSHALGMDAEGLTRAANAHLAMFMFHDRVAFGGTLLAIGTAYWWLSEFPLRAGQGWAWWAFAVSGLTGFASFLAYLGYGYLDTWHAVATVILFPIFVAGLWRSRRCIAGPLRLGQAWRSALPAETGAARYGRLVLQLCGLGLVLAGATIVGVGMTTVFVPQDLVFMALTREQIRAISPMLIPVIAHDRAGFGGGLLSCGLLILTITRHALLTRSFLEVMALMGLFGFGAALGVHGAIGYLDFVHLAPAYAGLLLFLAGWTLCARAYRADKGWSGAAAGR
jgi:hypothetical protein